MKTTVVGSWLLVAALALVAGCAAKNNDAESGGGGPGVPVPLASLQLKPSAGCDDLKRYLEASWMERVTSSPIYSSRGGGTAAVAGDGPAGAEPASASPDDVSQTNSQEPGVDEADRVKVDRNGYLYAVSNGFFVIEQGFPPEALHELSRVDLGASAYALYLDEANHRVVVIAYSVTHFPVVLAASAPFVPGIPEVQLIFIDVADPASPSITQRLSLEGFAVGSRRVGNRIHLVSRFWIALPKVLQDNQPLWDLIDRYQAAVRDNRTEERDQLKQDIRDAIHTAIESLDIEALLPQAVRQIDHVDTGIPLLTCADIYRPEVQLDPGLLVVTSVDTDGGNPSAAGIMNNAWQIYATRDNLYVSQSSGGWWWDALQKSQTAIYKFGLSDARPVYLATGSIDGWVKDQFSFSEYQGFLRVASTEDGFDRETNQWRPTNHLFVLEDTGDGALAVAGAVRGVAPGERIFAVRFLADRGFVVTFRRVDPLFAFDLSDPAKPVLVGETEIPGVSTYLHPIDRDHLLTVGREGGNIQLQIFDVSDLKHPTLQHRYIPPGAAFSFSDAEYDHLAFTYYAPRNLLVIPLVTTDVAQGSYFSGMAAYRVSLDDGFVELGRVDHADLARQAYCSDILPDELWRAQSCAQGWYLWGAAPRRSVVMTSGDATYLYSVSDIGIKATAIDAPNSTLGSVLFPNQGPLWWDLVMAAMAF